MNLLVTAGGTVVPIDRVRSIANRSTGRTGATIGLYAHARGHRVTLLTSNPDAIGGINASVPTDDRWTMQTYRTFDELHDAMAGAVTMGGFDAVVHSAAVSDYRLGGVYSVSGETSPQARGKVSMLPFDHLPKLIDRSAEKVKSDHSELWLRLVKAPKLIDLVRTEWKFAGVAVKFKLEAGVDDEMLLSLAERSRVQSKADLMVANTVEGAAEFAFVGPVRGAYERVARPELAARLIAAVERAHEERLHG